ncbi:MAG: bifunctional [glutamate--ammonia ligase]-adenylyl-L-tyrosine phosphorylase/[glutamate--ammonia-ligase] adenylyltransferase [Magnetococcales bacterium]|nr:bifunctional [glutamate--ammonia ligase]-adenylyl-L-tyrosine phosphorylase/[glutamate--ammonia-ligase] adenylyltransferase [Magnetococcales bacterium]
MDTPLASALEGFDLTPENKAQITDIAEKTVSPQTVAQGLTGFRDSHGDHPEKLAILTRALKDPLWQQRLITAFGNSGYLTRTILRWPEFLAEHLDAPSPLSPEALKRRIITDLDENGPSRQKAAQLLRHHKHRQFMRIGLMDLTNEATLMETTGALSALADATLEGALHWLTKLYVSRFGHPVADKTSEVDRNPEAGDSPTADSPAPAQKAQFVILGMGKLGGGELNFSSDVDLIFLYDLDEAHTDGPRPISIKEFYTRLGRDLMKLMSEPTADGMVFRVDLRLRPEGESGDLCLSSRSAETYYESWGQTWERAAMIKARPVAGNLQMGETFLKRIRPFVYRRYLDFAALDAIREMKRKIDRHITQAEDYHTNIKLGYGGIREIEFFVQSLQLIHGGRKPQLRIRGTLALLDLLAEMALITPEAARDLNQAYHFLRTVEHRLQIVQEQQVHSLPEEKGEFLALAKRMGFSSSDPFREKLDKIRSSVQHYYGNLFFESERSHRERIDPLVEALLECDPKEEACLAPLKIAGFTHPEQARGLLTTLQEGPPRIAITETARRWYTRLAPTLLQEIIQAPDQDMALQNAQEFLHSLGYRTSYLALLVENPLVLNFLVRLFGSSNLLSRFLNTHPELIDSLTTRDFLERYRGRAELSRSLAHLAAECDNPERRMEVIREFKNTELLRLGIRDLSGTADPAEVMAGLSTLADVILTQIMADAMEEMETHHGVPRFTDSDGHRHRAQFAILAMGKLGGRELNYASDLDLIFIHGSDGDDAFTDGERSVPNSQFFNRLGQKIVTSITTMTFGGKLYELDMRLRPSGNSGPLVTSLTSFRKYQHNDAWLWEHQALTRARVVVGDQELSRLIKEEIQTVLTKPRNPEEVQKEVDTMRQRMYGEKKPPAGEVDIKQTRGGIVDIEFLVQYLILAHAANHPEIAQRNATNALLSLHRAGFLDFNQYATLDGCYSFLRLVENRLRLLHDRSENRIGPDPQSRKRLGRLCGLQADEDIVAVLEEHFKPVRKIYDALLGSTDPTH